MVGRDDISSNQLICRQPFSRKPEEEDGEARLGCRSDVSNPKSACTRIDSDGSEAERHTKYTDNKPAWPGWETAGDFTQRRRKTAGLAGPPSGYKIGAMHVFYIPHPGDSDSGPTDRAVASRGGNLKWLAERARTAGTRHNQDARRPTAAARNRAAVGAGRKLIPQESWAKGGGSPDSDHPTHPNSNQSVRQNQERNMNQQGELAVSAVQVCPRLGLAA